MKRILYSGSVHDQAEKDAVMRVLDGGVSWVSPTGGLSFSSQGRVGNAVTVTLQNARGDTRQIVVSLLGGIEVS